MASARVPTQPLSSKSRVPQTTIVSTSCHDTIKIPAPDTSKMIAAAVCHASQSQFQESQTLGVACKHTYSITSSSLIARKHTTGRAATCGRSAEFYRERHVAIGVPKVWGACHGGEEKRHTQDETQARSRAPLLDTRPPVDAAPPHSVAHNAKHEESYNGAIIFAPRSL